MPAEIVSLEVFHLGRKVAGGDGSARVDLDDARSTGQLDEHLLAAARRHGHGPVTDYHLRVLDRHGNRVLLPAHRTTD